MAKVANNITELIGRTPLLELTKIEKEQRTKAQIVAKLEFLNPGRSVRVTACSWAACNCRLGLAGEAARQR